MTLMATDGGGGEAPVTVTSEIETVGSISFQVAPGDPDAINQAAVWHEQVSTQMNAHAAALQTASSQALSGWFGDAADSYRDLSDQMHAAFKAGEYRAGDTAATMRSISQQLETYQGDGTFAMREAQDWVQQAITDHQTATTLQGELTEAEGALKSMTTSTGNDMHLGINLAINDNSPQAQALQTKIAGLKRQLVAAKQALHEDNQQIERWDKKGEQAWKDAEAAVQRFMTIPIEPIPAPPMPGTSTFVTPPGKSFLDEAWDVFKDGAKDVGGALLDAGKYVLDHPVIIDGVAIVAMIAVPGAGLLLIGANGVADEGADYYQWKSGQISEQQFEDDSVENGVVTATGGAFDAAGDTMVKMATKDGATSISEANLARLIGAPATAVSGVFTAGNAVNGG